MAKKSKWEVNVGKRAVYKDKQGRTYSAPLILHEGQWMMTTSDGPAPITHHFEDDVAGRLEFVEYRDGPDARLHIEQGGDSFRALQSAGARATAAYQRQRQQQRREMLDALNQPNAASARAERNNNNLLATRWHRHRDVIPPPQLTKELIGEMAEAARYRKRKLEPES